MSPPVEGGIPGAFTVDENSLHHAIEGGRDGTPGPMSSIPNRMTSTPLADEWAQQRGITTERDISPEQVYYTPREDDHMNIPDIRNSSTLSEEQEQVVSQAAKNMSQSELELVNRRNERIAERSESSPAASENPPDKGKGTDPRNWGGIDIPGHELDVGNQAKAIDEAKQNSTSDAPKLEKSQKKHKKSSKKRH